MRSAQGRFAITAQDEKGDRSFIAGVRDREPAMPLEVHIQNDGIDFRLVPQKPQCLPHGGGWADHFTAGIEQRVLDRHGHQHLVFDDKDPVPRQYARHAHSPVVHAGVLTVDEVHPDRAADTLRLESEIDGMPEFVGEATIENAQPETLAARGEAGGPPRSSHRTEHTPSQCHESPTRPPGLDREPYLIALVSNSLNAIERASACFGLMRIAGPWSDTRPSSIQAASTA